MTAKQLPTGPVGKEAPTTASGTGTGTGTTVVHGAPPAGVDPLTGDIAGQTSIDPVAELAGAWAAAETDPLATVPHQQVADPAVAAGLDFERSGAGEQRTLGWESEWDPALARQGENDTAFAEVEDLPRPPAAVRKRTRGGGGIRLSGTDLEWLRWLGRYRFATLPQLEAKFGVTIQMVRRRIARLERMGLAVRYAWQAGAGSIALPTTDGMRVAMIDLPVPEFKRGTVSHELAVVSLGLMWEGHGLHVVTDREIRASLSPGRPLTDEITNAAEVSGIEAGTRPLFAVWQGVAAQATQARSAIAAAVADPAAAAALGKGMALGPGTGRGTKVQWHIPDLVIARAPKAKRSQTIAVEVELVAKPASDYRRILAAYADPACCGGVIASPVGGYGGVRYYVTTPALRDVILGVAQGMGLGTLVSAELLRDVDLPGAPKDLILLPRHASSRTAQLQAQRAEAARARVTRRIAADTQSNQ